MAIRYVAARAPLKLKSIPQAPGTSIGDGVCLTSIEHPRGLIDKIVAKILDGSLDARRPSGRPHIGEEGRAIEAQKPWLTLGVSRRTWYRRKKEQK